MRDPKRETKARKELKRLLRSLLKKEHFDTFFKLGHYHAKKILADGSIVQFIITEPDHNPRKSRKAASKKNAKGEHTAAPSTN